jgi:hypothetical protein
MSDTLASRWQVSALARGGFLIDPYEMVYLIGGWTYAGFETLQNNAQLGLNGGYDWRWLRAASIPIVGNQG